MVLPFITMGVNFNCKGNFLKGYTQVNVIVGAVWHRWDFTSPMCWNYLFHVVFIDCIQIVGFIVTYSYYRYRYIVFCLRSNFFFCIQWYIMKKPIYWAQSKFLGSEGEGHSSPQDTSVCRPAWGGSPGYWHLEDLESVILPSLVCLHGLE